tara:strand:+ start:259 stop:438 length:180 start_codon:yes stop_codon:yes gene_type:complete
MTEVKKDPEKERLYREAAKAFADPKQRLSKNRSVHIQRYVLRNRSSKNMGGKTDGSSSE